MKTLMIGGWFILLGFPAGWSQQAPTNVLPSSVISRPKPATSSLSGLLSNDQMALGLKQALTNGVKAAIAQLGHEGGFLTNANFRIPMPKQLKVVENALRSLKQDKLADEFVASMNHAAEKAVPEAAEVFATSISQMTLADAQTILTGPADAATKYFRRTTETNLTEKLLPIIKKATSATGVTSNYKKLFEAANKNKYLGGLLDAATDPKSLDVDRYVTKNAMDALFRKIAEEEKLIRENPTARTSELLKEVFGAFSK